MGRHYSSVMRDVSVRSKGNHDKRYLCRHTRRSRHADQTAIPSLWPSVCPRRVDATESGTAQSSHHVVPGGDYSTCCCRCVHLCSSLKTQSGMGCTCRIQPDGPSRETGFFSLPCSTNRRSVAYYLSTLLLCGTCAHRLPPIKAIRCVPSQSTRSRYSFGLHRSGLAKQILWISLHAVPLFHCDIGGHRIFNDWAEN